ncbi:hypothetical protein ACOTB6_24950 [Achromobacter xylosoxidans]
MPLEPTDFYRSHLRSLHVALLRHPIGIAHLSGHDIRLDGRTLVPGELIHGMDRMISTLEFAHLFTVFNGSRVHAQFARKPLHDAPAGLYFSIINNGLIQSPNKNRLGLYRARSKHDSTLTHGTSMTRAEAIMREGRFRSSNEGQVGPGAYFWAYEEDPFLAHEYGVQWWMFASHHGMYADDEDKSCAVLGVDVEKPEEEFLDLTEEIRA